MQDELAYEGGVSVGLAAVPEHQFLEGGELVDREVGVQGGLGTICVFNSKQGSRANSNANVCLVDHSNVIRSISNSSHKLTRVILEKAHQLCLLLQSASTSHKILSCPCDFEELQYDLLTFQNDSQGHSINHQYSFICQPLILGYPV